MDATSLCSSLRQYIMGVMSLTSAALTTLLASLGWLSRFRTNITLCLSLLRTETNRDRLSETVNSNLIASEASLYYNLYSCHCTLKLSHRQLTDRFRENLNGRRTRRNQVRSASSEVLSELTYMRLRLPDN